MFRRNSTRTNFTITPPPWSRRPLTGRYLAGLTFGVLGTLYYARHKIYADAPSDAHHDNHQVHSNPRNDHHYRDDSASRHGEVPGRWNDLHFFDKIREHSATGRIKGDSGIARIDATAVPNSTPRQDALALTSTKLSTGTAWTFLGIFDGLNGWENMNHTAPYLISAVLHALTHLVSTHELPSTEHIEVGMSSPHDSQIPSEEPYSDAVDRKIKETFVEFDNAVVHQGVGTILSSPSKAAAMNPLSIALSGTSALVSFYDLDTRLLKVALAGNSRAVLGRRAEREKGDQRFSYYEVHVLTTDQTVRNSSEQAAHVRSGSNGSSLARGFGLAAYKWSREIQERIHQDYLGDPPNPNIKMYPYLTAEPEITTIEIKPGDFLIMGSAGLWDSLTSEEAIGLVGLWLDKGMYQEAERHFMRAPAPTQIAFTAPSAQIIHPRDLPVSLGTKDETVMYRRWGAEKRFVCTDPNAAGHLTRNALGGADGDLTDALLSVGPPWSKKLRDDINTAVIFFDN